MSYRFLFLKETGGLILKEIRGQWWRALKGCHRKEQRGKLTNLINYPHSCPLYVWAFCISPDKLKDKNFKTMQCFEKLLKFTPEMKKYIHMKAYMWIFRVANLETNQSFNWWMDKHFTQAIKAG